MNRAADADSLFEYLRERDDRAEKRRWWIIFATIAAICLAIAAVAIKAVTDQQGETDPFNERRADAALYRD